MTIIFANFIYHFIYRFIYHIIYQFIRRLFYQVCLKQFLWRWH
jgi:hypothetical protein